MIRASINGKGSRLGGVIDAIARGLGAILQRARDRGDDRRMVRLPNYPLNDIGIDRQEIGRRTRSSAGSRPSHPGRATGDRSR